MSDGMFYMVMIIMFIVTLIIFILIASMLEEKRLHREKLAGRLYVIEVRGDGIIINDRYYERTQTTTLSDGHEILNALTKDLIYKGEISRLEYPIEK